MSFGIAVYDASGNQLVDVADSVMTILGTFTTSFTSASAPLTGNFTNAEFARGTPFAIMAKYPQQDAGGTPFPAYAKITFSGNVCTWRLDDSSTLEGFSPSNPIDGTLTFFYGYF